MILHKTTGQIYVGSAYGEIGLLGRWREYAKTGHGGNKALKHVDPHELRWSILRIIPLHYTSRQIIEVEQLEKEKLGSLVHGLNEN